MLGSIHPAYSQTEIRTDSSKYWVNIGVGFSSPEFTALGVIFSHELKNEKNIITLRLIRAEEIRIFSSPSNAHWDLGVLAGVIRKKQRGMVSISAGGSIVGGKKKEDLTGGELFDADYSTKNYTTVGLPINSQIFFTPFSHVGIGLNGFANINPKKSFAGVLVCLQIGKI